MYVYFIRPQNDGDKLGVIKVGFSRDPLRRLAELQGGHPWPLIFMRLYSCRSEMHARHIEALIHGELRHVAVGGGAEWFADRPYRQCVRAKREGWDRGIAARQYPTLLLAVWNSIAGTHQELVQRLQSSA